MIIGTFLNRYDSYYIDGTSSSQEIEIFGFTPVYGFTPVSPTVKSYSAGM